MAYVLTWFASVFILYVYVYYYIFWKQFLLFDRLLRFSFQTLLLYWFPCWISLKNFVRSEISSNSPRTFEAPIVLVRRNYERYFAVDASELRTQEGKFILLESSVRNFERKFALLIAAKCSPRIVVMHCRNIRNHSHPFKQLFYRSFLLKPQWMFDCWCDTNSQVFESQYKRPRNLFRQVELELGAIFYD